jgi:mevalonate kinase
MVKHEIKLELNKTEEIKKIIELAYFKEGFGGKILGKKHFINITKDDDVNWTIFNGLHNTTVKITNDEVIDGTMRFVIDESENDLKWIEALNLAQSCFLDWGLVPNEAQKHIDVLSKAGALCSKMTGSGGGGYILSLWPREYNLNQIEDSLRQQLIKVDRV